MADTPIDNISNGHERDHFANQDSIVARLKKYYSDVIQDISNLIASNASKAVIRKKLDQLLTDMVSKSVSSIETGMQKSWQISNAKTKSIFEAQYKGIDLPETIHAALNDHRNKALRQFIERKENGLDLSDRVWKTADQFRDLIDEKVDEGIGTGKAAAKIARELKAELLNPQTQDKPGRGVYKSPYKNAERLARTEINMAYRQSDQAGWAANPLILGYEIKLSATAKPKARCELCTQLEGSYPVWFVWVGWHPNCLCFKIPILMSRDMLTAYNKLIAQGRDTAEEIAKLQKDVRIIAPPSALSNWIKTNEKRVSGWARNPYWWEQNSSFVDSILKPDA